jgi:hypothetical protein
MYISATNFASTAIKCSLKERGFKYEYTLLHFVTLLLYYIFSIASLGHIICGRYVGCKVKNDKE